MRHCVHNRRGTDKQNSGYHKVNGQNNVEEDTESTSQDSDILEIKESYTCNYCEIGFSKTSMLSEHMSATHVDKFPQKVMTKDIVEDEPFEDFAFEYTPKKAKPEDPN